MPCLRCRGRQGDPARGSSAWKRGVSAGEQVLVCPLCQQDAGWQSALDHCAQCDGVRLSKTLGVLRCAGCGWSVETSAAPPVAGPTDEQLAADVRAALGRVFGGPEATPAQ